MASFINIVQHAYLQEFRRPVSPVLKIMESYARHNRIPILDWQSADLLETLITAKQSLKVLELGTAIGYSTIRITQLLTGDAVIYTIEKSPDSVIKAREYFDKANVTGRIQQIEGEAKDILKDMRDTFDFIFLDADKKDYVDLLELILPRLQPGGILFVDNLLWRGFVADDDENVPENSIASVKILREFNQQFMEHPSLQSIILPVGDGVGVGVKKF